MSCRFLIVAFFTGLSVAISADTGDEAFARYEAGDYKTAFQSARPAAEKGQASAQYVMGRLYHDGLGLPQDFAKALHWYRRAAEQQYAPAKSGLGYMYRKGEGVPQNYERAYFWFREAADQGFARGMANIGFMHQQGLGVPQDDSQAVEWYRKAADLGLDDAQSNLGFMYANGRGVPVNLVEAARFQRLAAEQGQAMAQLNLGLYYLNGEGVKKSDKTAAYWLERAATQGQMVAQRELGILCAERKLPYKDLKSARKWLRLAADQGDSEAIAALSALHLDAGIPVGDDMLRMLYAAAEKGEVDAYEELGLIFLVGRNVPKDAVAAVRWFRMAAEKGSVMARHHLGRCYESGLGAPKDHIEAHAQYSLAKEKGHDGAGNLAGRLEKTMSSDQIDAARRRANLYRRPERAGEAMALHEGPRFSSAVDRAPSRGKTNTRNFALVIGIEKYKTNKDGGGLPRADFAERDAQAVRNYLPALGIPSSNVIYLAGRDATYSSIQLQLQDWLPKNISSDSTLFVYFAGHGATNPAGGEALLVPWDGDVEFLRTTALRRDDVLGALQKLKAKHVVVILDTCFSGTGGRSVPGANARPLTVKTDDFKAIPGNVVLLVSAAGGQIAGTLEEEGHGIFTYHLLNGLGGKARDSKGMITLEGLYKYLQPLVEKAARLQNHEQTPLLLGGPPSSFPPLIQ